MSMHVKINTHMRTENLNRTASSFLDAANFIIIIHNNYTLIIKTATYKWYTVTKAFYILGMYCHVDCISKACKQDQND